MFQQQLNIPVSGMTRANCAMNTERNFRNFPGISGNLASEQTLVFFNSDLMALPETIRFIRQNFFRMFFHNTSLISVMAEMLSPFDAVPIFMRRLHRILTVLAISFSTITAVLNSLRLYRFWKEVMS